MDSESCAGDEHEMPHARHHLARDERTPRRSARHDAVPEATTQMCRMRFPTEYSKTRLDLWSAARFAANATGAMRVGHEAKSSGGKGMRSEEEKQEGDATEKSERTRGYEGTKVEKMRGEARGGGRGKVLKVEGGLGGAKRWGEGRGGR